MERECEHRAVASSFPAVLWRRLDQRDGLLRGEEGHDSSFEPFGGDAQHTGDHRGMFGVAQRGVAEQCADRGEPQVAGSRAVVAVGFKVLEERGDQRLVEIAPVQRRRRDSGPVVGEAQQQAQAVAVGGDRARAGVQLAGSGGR